MHLTPAASKWFYASGLFRRGHLFWF